MFRFAADTKVNWDLGIDTAHEQVTQSLRDAQKAFDKGHYKDAEEDLTKAYLFLSQLESSISYMRDDIRKEVNQ